MNDNKVSGIKRKIAVDTEGLPHVLSITKTNVTVTDRMGAVEARSSYQGSLFAVEMVFVDGSSILDILLPRALKS